LKNHNPAKEKFMKPSLPVKRCLILLFFFVCGLSFSAWGGSPPISVDIWDPPFNEERRRTSGQYPFLEKAEKPWRICACIPHLKDSYFLSVNYALIDQAKQLGVGVQLFEAGGYGNLDVQRQQVKACVDKGADGVILTGVSLDGLNDLIEGYAADRGIPVIDLINGLSSPKIAARAAATFWDMGNLVGKYLVKLHGEEKKKVRVAWFPGPDGAGWVAAGDAGFNAAIAGSPVTLVATRHGDTGRTTQGRLVEEVLDDHPDIDYIVGTAVTAEAALKILRKRKLLKKIHVLPYYYGPGVHQGIRRGYFLAAPSDMPGLQTRIALDQMVRILEGKDYTKHVGAKVRMIERKSIQSFDPLTSLPPGGFRPIFSINAW
jgi:periplasmic protein TorT